MKTFIITFFLLAISTLIFAQNIPVEGYVYESGNRGYLDLVSIKIFNESEVLLSEVITDRDGFFSFQAEKGVVLRLKIDKSLYDSQLLKVSVPKDKEKHFVNVEMKRSPGYLFEVTIAEERVSEEVAVDALKGYRIDVYNNTKGKEDFVLEEYNKPVFQIPLIKENHYTVLIRKDGFMSKRIEAFVDIEGCILCFEGLGSVGPGVSETLSEHNTIGVLLANVSMVKAYKGKKMQVNDIYYDLGKWNLKSKSKVELNKLAVLMKDNPRWIVELGSHTDSRGSNDNNLILSKKRAQSAVDYLVIEKSIDRNRISAKGYGEINLLNDCNDTKKCSEKDHLINRRTEIKIVGIAAKMRYQSLAEIKRSENMDALLQDIQFGEQVMVPVYNAKEDSLLNATKDSIENSLAESDLLIVELDSVDLVSHNDSIDLLNIKLDNESNLLKESDVKIIVEEVEHMEEIIENEIAKEVKSSVDEVGNNDSIDDVVKEKVNPSSNVENELSELKYEKVISRPVEKEETDASFDNEPSTKAEEKKSNINIKIVLLESAEAISKSHELYTTHDDVKEIYHNGKFKYMFGDFKTMEEAKDFLKKSIKMVYPNAYVVRFN